MKQNISTEATLVLLNTLLNEAGVSARQQYEKILPGRSLGQNRSGEAKANRRDAFRFRTARVPGMPADFIQRQEAVRTTVVFRRFPRRRLREDRRTPPHRRGYRGKGEARLDRPLRAPRPNKGHGRGGGLNLKTPGRCRAAPLNQR